MDLAVVDPWHAILMPGLMLYIFASERYSTLQALRMSYQEWICIYDICYQYMQYHYNISIFIYMHSYDNISVFVYNALLNMH